MKPAPILPRNLERCGIIAFILRAGALASLFLWAPAAGCADVMIAPVTARPCLLFDASDLPRFKKNAEAFGMGSTGGTRRIDPSLAGILQGDQESRRKATAQFMADVREHLGGDTAARFGPVNNPYSPLRRMRRLNELLYRYDVIDSFGCLTREEEKEFRDDVIRAVNFILGSNPAKFPSPRTPNRNGLEFPNGLSTCNRWADQFAGAVLAGLNFPDEPMSKPWVEYGIGQIQYMLDHGEWDGAWNEVPRYHDATLRIFNPLFIALKRRTGVDFFKHRSLKPLLDWYVRFSSPPVRFPSLITPRTRNGEPTTPVWGDSNYNSAAFSTLALYAPQFAASDPDFSKRLLWMWRRAGSSPATGSIFDTFFPVIADPALPDAPQVLGSDLSRKLGLVSLRSGFDTPDETWVFMRGGSQGITHKRSDLGSVDLFSKGIPLAIGSQSGPYGPGIEWNYSQQSNNVVVFGGKSRDRGECSGVIDAFFTSPRCDYAVADCSRPASRLVTAKDSFKWRRHLLLVKQPDYLVVWDEIESPQASEVVSAHDRCKAGVGRLLHQFANGLRRRPRCPRAAASAQAGAERKGGALRIGDAGPRASRQGQGKRGPLPFRHTEVFHDLRQTKRTLSDRIASTREQ